MNQKAVTLTSGLRVTYRSDKNLHSAAHDLILSSTLDSRLSPVCPVISPVSVSRVAGGVVESSVNHPVMSRGL